MASEVDNEAVHPTSIPQPHHQIRRKPVPSNNMPRPRPPPAPKASSSRAVINDAVHLSSGRRMHIQSMQDMSAASPPGSRAPDPQPYDSRFDKYILKAYGSTFGEFTTLKSNLDTLRADYRALENELRQRMDEYVAAREEARKWKERCIALERREDEDHTTRSLRAQNDRFARIASGQEKMGEVWRRKDSLVWVRENAEKKKRNGQVGLKRISQAMVGCGKKLRRRWGGWKL